MPKIKSLAPREHFPALQGYTYLNAASIAIMPAPAREAMERFSRQILHVGTVSLDEEAETLALEGPRKEAAALIGADPDQIAITNSATEALGQLAWAIEPRGNVVSIDIEFPSVVYPWLRVAKKTGAQVRLVRVMDDPASLKFEDVEALVDDRTSVVCVSHVQYATGYRLDPKRLADLAHAHGALCIIDATQSAGVVPIDVAASGVDALVSAAYKWLCGPFGAAIFYASPALMERLEPVFVGWRGTANPFHFDARQLTYAPTMRRYEYSTMNYAAGFGLAESIRYIRALDVGAVLNHALKLSDLLMEGLDALGAEVLTPREHELRAGIVTARFPGRDGEKVAAELNRRGVVVSPRFNATRFATHFFNDSDDVERALHVLREILHGGP